LKAADGTVEIVQGSKSTLFSERYACPTCGLSLPELEPRQFSFNSPFGACPDCSGLGTRREVNPDLVLGDPSLSILEGVILPWGEPSGYIRKVSVPSMPRAFKFDLNAPWRALPAQAKKVVLSGAPGKTLTFQYDSERWHGEYESGWDGVLKHVERRYRETASDSVREQLEEFMVEQPCPTCRGKRLRPESLSVLLHGKSIGDVVDLPVSDALAFFESIPLRRNGRPGGGLDPEIARPILKEVNDRLRFLRNVGLDYLTLGRSADSLSGGEAQRIRLATQIGSRLVGVLYILDEPSIGLHQRDNARLLATLKELRDIGNTVLVVEHDEETIRAADHLVDLGPRAGRDGRLGLGQVHARDRHPVSGAGPLLLPRQGDARGARSHRRARTHRQGHRHRSEPDRPDAALQPGDLQRAVHTYSRVVHLSPGVQDPRVRAGPVLVQREGRALRGMSGGRSGESRDALPAGRLRAVRGV